MAALRWGLSSPPEALTADVPLLPYRSRAGEPKIAVHWGQRKLLISELQVLLPPFTNAFERVHHVCYVGSAPGAHLLFLDELFGSTIRWTLVDPGEFDKRLTTKRDARFRVINDYFDMRLCYSFVADVLATSHPALGHVFRICAHDEADRVAAAVAAAPQREVGHIDAARMTTDVPTMSQPLFEGLPLGLHLLVQAGFAAHKTVFVSDVRSGTPDMPNFSDHVKENMMAQCNWVRAIQPTVALLKFRLPYPHEKAQIDRYLDGTVLLPVWGSQTTTECRLVVPRGAAMVPYDCSKHEQQMFFVNAVLRERVHFNHDLLGHEGHDARFDSAAEAAVLRRLVQCSMPHVHAERIPAEVRRLSSVITQQLGETLDDARRKTDALLCAPTKKIFGDKRFRVEQPGRRTTAVQLKDVLARRGDPVFWRALRDDDMGPVEVWHCHAMASSPPTVPSGTAV